MKKSNYHEITAARFVPTVDAKERNAEARRLAEFGMFGLDFRETKSIVNKLLARHGLVLKTQGKAKWNTDQTEVWIEEV